MKPHGHRDPRRAPAMTGMLPHATSARGPDPRTLPHDARSRRAAIIMTLAFWASNYIVQATRDLYSLGGLHADRLLVRLGLALAGGGLCYLVHLVIRALGASPFQRRAIVVALLIPFVADGYSWINFYGFQLLGSDPAAPASTTSQIIFTVVYWVWFFMAWAALYLALLYSNEARAQERRLAAIHELAHSAQLRALRYQVNPHFLFNTLNAISALILDRHIAQAEAMIGRLAAFFRAGLALDPLDDVTLAEEIALQRLYLEIEQVRFPDLSIAIEVPTALESSLVPSLILQPLIENSIKYGVTTSVHPANLLIRAREDGNWLMLDVIDNGGSGIVQACTGTGIGLDNVRARLVERFGEVHRFEAGPTAPSGYRVTLGMPLRIAR